MSDRTFVRPAEGAILGAMLLQLPGGCETSGADLLLVIRREAPSASSTRGSWNHGDRAPEVAPFTSVELAGTLVIHVGSPLCVEVTGDHNLVRRINTTVGDRRLVSGDTGSFRDEGVDA